jgi:Cu-processing system ATP-binding protein
MIEFVGLTKRFAGFTALDGISFEVRMGETFALLGPNGSGKTTALKCLMGLCRPTSGWIRVLGIEVQSDPRGLRQKLSYLPQRVSFPDALTAREVLEFYGRLRKTAPARMEELLHRSEFDFNGFPDKPVRELSGGMQQRLGLAVACLPDAPVMVLDEPTVSLDPEGAIQFRQFLAGLKARGKTILFSSHVLSEVERLADRVAILVGGRLIALESAAGLREGLSRQCTMHVAVAGPVAKSAKAALRAGAEWVRQEERALLVVAPPEARLSVLKAIESEAGPVVRFSTREQSLEDVYLRYMHEANARPEPRSPGRLQ